MPQDYYEILGVARDATGEQIKVAYRKLAVECHPDRCPDDPEAEERFKQAAEAYDALRDSEKRRRYDMFGHEGLRGAGARTFSSYEDIFTAFGDIFGTGFGSIFGDFFGAGAGTGAAARRSRGASLRCQVTITFEEAADGVEKIILLRRAERCENCSGSGAKPGTSPSGCPTCNGRGEVTRSQGFFAVRSMCPKCKGRGEVVDTPCPKCGGTGLTSQEHEIAVRIPPGIEDGSRLRIPGEGEPGEHGGPHGDLYCFISLAQHPFFERRGDDLLLDVPVSYTEAAIGTHVEVPTLNGLRSMKVPAGTQSGTILRLRNEGFPNVHGYGRGDQLVRISVEVPRKLSRDHQKLIKKLEEFDGKHTNPQKLQYARKLEEHYKDNKSKPREGKR
jgi:molecular chaperone DnaJ